LVSFNYGGDVDLPVYLLPNRTLAATAMTYKPAFCRTGDMEGTGPKMHPSPKGSVIVVFENDAVGRDRRQFTRDFREGEFVVAGYANKGAGYAQSAQRRKL
jgi:hypothetical protein